MKRDFTTVIATIIGIACIVWASLFVLELITPLDAQLTPLAWQSSTAYEKNHVFLPTRLANLTISFHTASYRTLMIFDATTVPVDGGSQTPYVCMEGITQSSDSAEEFKSISFVQTPLVFTKGIAVTVSTSTAGCTTLTSDGSNDWFQVQASGQP